LRKVVTINKNKSVLYLIKFKQDWGCQIHSTGILKLISNMLRENKFPVGPTPEAFIFFLVYGMWIQFRQQHLFSRHIIFAFITLLNTRITRFAQSKNLEQVSAQSTIKWSNNKTVKKEKSKQNSSKINKEKVIPLLKSFYHQCQ